MPTPRNHMPMNDKLEILQAISGVSETVAGLRSDMSYMRDKMDELGRKVDKVEELKASRPELNAAESRWDRSLDQYKNQAKIDFDQYRVQAKIDFEQHKAQAKAELDELRKDKVDISEFNPASFDVLLERVDRIEQKADNNEAVISNWTNRAKGGWTVMQKGGVVISAIIASISYFIHEVLPLFRGK